MRINRNRRLTTDPHDEAFLDRTQQLDLHRQWHLADLIEEQRPAMRLFENAFAGGARR